MLAILLLPEGRTDRALVEEIFGQLRAACEALGITLIGGHSEVTYGLDRPILAGFMLGEVEAERLITPRGARAGDRLILSKPIAIEGTAVIARRNAPSCCRSSGGIPAAVRRFPLHPRDQRGGGRPDRPARRAGARHARSHRGGLATGLWELAEAAGLGLRVEGEAVPVYPETQALCAHYGWIRGGCWPQAPC
jgi:hydrogenase expression/formation protein HypE